MWGWRYLGRKWPTESETSMTVKEVASELDLSLWTVWRLCTAGAIASWRDDGRILIRPEAVSAFARSFPLAA